MKKQIKRVSPLQNAKVVAVLYLVLSSPILAIMALVGGMMNQPGMLLAAMLLFVAGYVVSGFIFALIGGGVYNLVASQVGGFEFTSAEVTHG